MIPLVTNIERHEWTGSNEGERFPSKGSLEGSDVAGYCLSTMMIIKMMFACVFFIPRVSSGRIFHSLSVMQKENS